MSAKNGEVLRCDYCGKEFYLPKCRLPKDGEYRYCSMQCKGKFKTVLTIKDYEIKNNIDNMGIWIKDKYIDNQLTIREVMELLNTRANRTIMGFLKFYDIPIRYGSEAIKSQWIGEKSIKRREKARAIAEKHLCSETARDILRKNMQTDEYKLRCSLVKLGEKNGMYGTRGVLSPKWKPEKTQEERMTGRKLFINAQWRKEVFERDNYTCQCCGDNRGGSLVAHHLNSYNSDVENRFNVNNGITILSDIHKQFHKQYGYGNNTKEQFEGFKQNYRQLALTF